MKTCAELLDKCNEGWVCLFKALNDLTSEDLQKEIYLGNQGYTLVETINRQEV